MKKYCFSFALLILVLGIISEVQAMGCAGDKTMQKHYKLAAEGVITRITTQKNTDMSEEGAPETLSKVHIDVARTLKGSVPEQVSFLYSRGKWLALEKGQTIRFFLNKSAGETLKSPCQVHKVHAESHSDE